MARIQSKGPSVFLRRHRDNPVPSPRTIPLSGLLCLAVMLLSACQAAPPKEQAGEQDVEPQSVIQPLRIRGQDFVDEQGRPVRFWGVNLVALYPSHAEAETLAARLAECEVNLVRPHHMLRPSRDWVTRSQIASLATYKDDSRRMDAEAWDRFDYLNAQLRKRGIYLALALRWSRLYLPGDADILTTDAADQAAWQAAMTELNSWPWQKNRDVRKMLPMIDERVAALDEEFARTLLTHVNPYTHLAYGKDPQVLTIETINEASTEYALVCGNRLPDYWQKKLDARWTAFAREHGADGGDLYKPADANLVRLRAAFFRKLDEDHFRRMRKLVRDAGCDIPMTFSNLWRGENALKMHAETADTIEDHAYVNPLVTDLSDDLPSLMSHSALTDKPFLIGEINEAEGDRNVRAQGPYRTMLPLAAAAYGCLHNWSGVVWFAWIHGDKPLGPDGWALSESREPNIGHMITDGMMIDHLRTAGILFKRGLAAKSVRPITLYVDEPLAAKDYNALMRGKYSPRPGWQDIHAIRKTFGAAPESQKDAEWLRTDPANPLVSDTGEIVKDTARRQLTVAAAKAEAFSGFHDDKPPAGLRHLRLGGGADFATVILVSLDGADLGASRRLLISRTALDAAKAEVSAPAVTLAGLAPAEGNLQWQIRLTRPRQAAAVLREFAGMEFKTLQADANGQLTLPGGGWHECELQLRLAP